MSLYISKVSEGLIQHVLVKNVKMRKRAKRNLRMNWIIRRINILIIINYPEWDILQNGKLTAIISNPNIITWLDIFSIGLNRRSNASVIRTKNSIIGITQLLFLQKNCLIAAFNDLDAFLIPIIAVVVKLFECDSGTHEF